MAPVTRPLHITEIGEDVLSAIGAQLCKDNALDTGWLDLARFRGTCTAFRNACPLRAFRDDFKKFDPLKRLDALHADDLSTHSDALYDALFSDVQRLVSTESHPFLKEYANFLDETEVDQLLEKKNALMHRLWRYPCLVHTIRCTDERGKKKATMELCSLLGMLTYTSSFSVAHCFKLLAQGADVNACGLERIPIFSRLCARFREDPPEKWKDAYVSFELIEACIALGADVKSGEIGSRRKATPLHWATLANSQRLIKLLLCHGANVNAVDNCRCTALHWSADTPREALMDMLYDSCDDSSTAGHVVHELIVGGANINARDLRGHRALFMCLARQRFLHATYLANAGARLDSGDAFELRPLLGRMGSASLAFYNP